MNPYICFEMAPNKFLVPDSPELQDLSLGTIFPVDPFETTKPKQALPV